MKRENAYSAFKTEKPPESKTSGTVPSFLYQLFYGIPQRRILSDITRKDHIRDTRELTLRACLPDRNTRLNLSQHICPLYAKRLRLTSLEVIPPFAITNLGMTDSPPTSDCTASEIRTESRSSSSLLPVSAVTSALLV